MTNDDTAPTPDAGSDLAREAILNCAEAVAFFDQVKAASEAEKSAVGADHWNWLESACRRVAAFASASPPPAEDLAGQGEPFGDDILHATISVRRDGSTGCRLQFGNGVKFLAGRSAVYTAIEALVAEAQGSSACPASPRPTPDLAGQGEPVATALDDRDLCACKIGQCRFLTERCREVNDVA